MVPSNRNWLPSYCDPGSFLPMVQETRMVFRRPPYLFQDFVGKAVKFLQSDLVAKMGFHYDPKLSLPCKWKCADESLFGVDLCLFAYTGQYPFDKGLIGGLFNEGSVGAATHHAPINLDFGGSHVGYLPGEGTFGHIPRPLHRGHHSTDCGAMMALLAPFKNVYDDACQNILLFKPDGDEPMASVPNEFLQPSWSTETIKLMVDVDNFAKDVVAYDPARPHTRKIAGRSLFHVQPAFLEGLDPAEREKLLTPEPTPVGENLTCEYFHIFDTEAVLRHDGVPAKRILPYVKYILTARDAPYPLKAAVINTNIEYNRLSDAVRSVPCREFAFACFTGVFIDVYDEQVGAYVNLFQPVGVSIKPAGRVREYELAADEVHDTFDRLSLAEPVVPIEGVLGYERPQKVLDSFTFNPAGR